MSKQHNRLPHQVDPFRLAEAGSQLTGSLPLSQMRRLSSFLANEEGQIQVELHFAVDDLGVPCVQGNIQVILHLTCQRCLEQFDYPVEHAFSLAWVHSEAEIEKLPTRYEPYLVEATPLMLNEVIEDELLLALPLVPIHPVEVCKAKVQPVTGQVAAASPAKRDNPFAVLKSLKTTRKSK